MEPLSICDELISYFEEVVLNTEYDDNPKKVLKWTEKMNLFIIKDENLDFCTTRAVRDNSNKKIPGLSFNLPTKLVMKLKNPFIHGTLMIKKLLILKKGLYDENFYYAQDYKLFYDLLKDDAKFKVMILSIAIAIPIIKHNNTGVINTTSPSINFSLTF